MAAIIPAATQIASVLGTAASVASAVNSVKKYSDARKSQELALRQLKEKQDEKMRSAYENAAIRRETLRAKSEIAEKNRRAALKRAVARQRVKFGASGISSSGGGSAQAVLLGLFDESDDERKYRERLDNIKKRSLDIGLEQKSRINTLQRTQLKQRNRLKNSASVLDEASDWLGIFG